MEANQNNQQPHTIFDAINANIVGMSEDMNLMHQKVDDLLAKVNVIYRALVVAQETEQEKPNTTGDTPADKRNKVGGDNV
nr:MAG TPA: hypothetical protein [Caudoviricetes sp.]